MTEKQLAIQFERMEMMCNTFKSNSEDHIQFLPEFEASKSINAILRESENLSPENYNEILKILADTVLTIHYDGSQWYDYKIHLNSVLRHKGFESDIF